MGTTWLGGSVQYGDGQSHLGKVEEIQEKIYQCNFPNKLFQLLLSLSTNGLLIFVFLYGLKQRWAIMTLDGNADDVYVGL